MLEDIYETVRGVLFNDWPKNSSDIPVIYDLPIKKWHLGEFTLTGLDTPTIVIKGESVGEKDAAYGTREEEFRLTITAYVQSASRELSERHAQEAARLLDTILRKHRRLWVVGICPICQKSTLSPQHFVIEHNDILAPYVTDVQDEFDDVWALTHTSTAPSLGSSALSGLAFLAMYDSVIDQTNPPITNLTAAARKRILSYKEKLRRPVRLLYDVAVTDAKTSDGGEGQQLLYAASLTLSAKELLRVAEYGPDNVPTASWERRK
ncbi:MAG: hypothetical protein JSS66_04985 [Armatimonadetes bacterium]|nr:hypothetical protein [Armatimonadota bacterium]